uniref:DUF4837 family protein n=1 Tax=Segatella hominis TaxID=2518605 RepID=UPI004038B98F
MMKWKYLRLFLAICFVFVLACCKDGKSNRLPESIGQPYEVVLEGDTNRIVTAILQESEPDMPQPESMFNIIQVRKGKLTSLYQTVRNRVVVDVDKRNRDFEVKISKDVNAAPQVIIRIKAQAVEQLKSRLDRMRLRQILDESELKHLASVIRQNVEKQKEVKRLFGIDMRIPLDMDASKKAKDFVWYSNNTNSGMKNLLVFKINSSEKNPSARENHSSRENLSAGGNLSSKETSSGTEEYPSNGISLSLADKVLIDSVLQKNMLGETDEMYMVIPRLGERGLWEMEGDAMGGPYVMKIIRRQKNGKISGRKNEIIVVIGFVYAPEMKKRNLIKQLEAVLTTIR